jgi:hypothetical protein
MAHYQQTKIDVGSLRTELQDTIHEFQRERADMFLSLRSLDQQLQLKAFIIDVSSMLEIDMHQHTCLWSNWREVYTIGHESYWDKANSMDCVISSQSSLHTFLKKYTINHYWLGKTSILHVHRVSTLLKSVESYIMKSFQTVLTELRLQSVENDMTFNPNSCSKQLNLFPWSLSEFYSSRGGHKNNEAHTLG